MPTKTTNSIIDDVLKIASEYHIEHTEETFCPRQIILFYQRWEQAILIRNRLNGLREKYNGLKVIWDYQKMSITVSL